MAALDRNNLVKNGKYNLAEIMKRAWAYVKDPFCTQYRNNFKAALKAAWIDAKLVMDEVMKPKKETVWNPNVSVAMLRAASCSENMRRGNVCW